MTQAHSGEPLPGKPQLAVRVARRSDVGVLAGIEAACFTCDRLSRRSLARLAESGSAVVLIAEIGSEPVGSAVVLLRAASRQARLYSLAVLPAHDGQGAGSALLAAAEKAAADFGRTAMTLEVRGDNVTAIRLYTRRGYETFGSSLDYYGDGQAAIRMRKVLPAGRARILARPALGGASA